ncbi:putative peripheral membrane protein [Flagelloscypha sp. PMI_526]|nr:putative peripheral membrane protein [Flagelloscypha sp. PMI_526]
MLSLYKAESGELVQVRRIGFIYRARDSLGSLEVFLSEHTSIHQEDVLAFLSDGLRLTSANVRDLAGSRDQAIFLVLNELHVQPSLHAAVEGTTSPETPPFRASLVAAAYLQAADAHLAASATRELQRQQMLLHGLNADLNIISRAMKAGDRARTLGDYVNPNKMVQVGLTSRKTHEQLRADYDELEKTINSLSQGADEVRQEIQANPEVCLLDDAASAYTLAQGIYDSIAENSSLLDSVGDSEESDSSLQEFRMKDTTMRDQVLRITQLKNTYTAHLIQVLQHITILNSTLSQIPDSLVLLQGNIRNTVRGTGGGGASGFGHIQRLHRMPYAYSATVVEVVRRKEFARFFYSRAQNVLEVIGKISTAERKRRLAFRSEVHGQLPFEVRGLDDPIPHVELVFTPPPASLDEDDGTPKLTRTDWRRWTGMEDAWEKGVERQSENCYFLVLSSSKASIYRHSRRSTSYDDQAYQELTELLRLAQERRHPGPKNVVHSRLNYPALTTSKSMQGRNNPHIKQQYESELNARRATEDRHSALSNDFDALKKEHGRALADAKSQAQLAESLRSDLAEARAQHAELARMEDLNSKRVQDLLQEQQSILRNLDETHGRGIDLEQQIKTARRENQDMIAVNEQLRAEKKEKEKMLKEHERAARDMRAEADGDRAVLEREFFETKAALEEAERGRRDAQAEAEITNIDAKGLREELKRVEGELRESRAAERDLRDDLRQARIGQDRFEHDLDSKNRLVAEILDVALSFRNSHVKALATAQHATTHPARFNSSTLTESVSFTSPIRLSIIGQPDGAEPSAIEIDPSNPEAALETLRSFDHDTFSEAVAKTGSTIRKWQKQCKEYRERAKGKISFRNFAKGDLALFLPTRNSVSKPWAAFNVSFPHYFLQATGHLAEQLQHREWIVARITSISERVVDSKDPTSNPYGLGDGVKYYMLQVEDWTQPSNSKRRTSSRKVSTGEPLDPKPSTSLKAEEILPPPPGPPVTDIEDSFHVMNPSNTHLHSLRSRTNSSPSARPSSLSRLLAQASSDMGVVEGPEPPPDTPLTEDSAPFSPPAEQPILSSGLSSPRGPSSHQPGLSSPLRPGFSVGRIPLIGSASSSSSGAIAKAAATTALTERHSIPSPSSPDNPFTSPATPSPEGSVFEGMSSLILNRRRTRFDIRGFIPRELHANHRTSGTIPTNEHGKWDLS